MSGTILPSKLRILVLGYIVRGPLGGSTWHSLQHVLGLMRLGHDVWFLEDSEDYPCCYDPKRHIVDEDPSYGLHYAAKVFAKSGLADCWAYFDAHKDVWHGPKPEQMVEVCKSADLLINLAGINTLRPWLENVPKRAYVDIDPAFDQIRNLTDATRRERTLAHNVFFTRGENIPIGKANLPDDGIAWQAMRAPAVLDSWPFSKGPADGKFTTVMRWDSYDARDYAGQRYGMKADSFADYMDLPSQTHAKLEMALGSPNAPRKELRKRAWSIVDSLVVTEDPWTYQDYIQSSKAEFTVAKHAYVVSNCGWFSERSALYLASGRPVVTQETGFSEHLPTGEGLLSFMTAEEALAGIEEINSRYDFHCRRARDLAVEYFDSDNVLSHMLERAMS